MISSPSAFQGFPRGDRAPSDRRWAPSRNDNTPLASADLQPRTSLQTVAGERGNFLGGPLWLGPPPDEIQLTLNDLVTGFCFACHHISPLESENKMSLICEEQIVVV